jgi:hypothetical protein
LVGRAFGIAAGTTFGIATAIAAGRLILFNGGVPRTLKAPLAWDAFGIHPLGWPLVGAAVAAALAILAIVTLIALDRIDDLIRTARSGGQGHGGSG